LKGEEEEWEEEELMVRGTVYIKDNVRRVMGRIKEKVEERRGETGWTVGEKRKNGKEGSIGGRRERERKEVERQGNK